MPELDDHDLLAEFARTESEAAFAALVARYVNLVYSAALRFAGNPHHAEEITQAVFIILARRAGKLSPRAVLSGWLYQTTRLTAANFMKGEIRRQHREQEAYMQSILTEPDAAAWQQLAPHLDEAMGRLGDTDRDAIVLRFFENKTAREVGAALKLTEAAAHKRVNRALEKLRKLFSKRGVTLSSAIIAGAVSANSVQAAPAALAGTISAVAVAKGATASISTLTLVKGALKIMAWTKAKTAVVAGVAILLAGATTAVIVEATQSGPDIQGIWQGTLELPGMGIQRGEKPKTRLVFEIVRKDGRYLASGVNIDQGKNAPLDKFSYRHGSIHAEVTAAGVVFDGAVNKDGTAISGTYKEGKSSTRLNFTRTNNPPAFPEALTDADFAPRAGSVLQGYWKGAIQTGKTSLAIAVKISEPSNGTFRADFYCPPEDANRQPASVEYDGRVVKVMTMAGYGMFQGALRNGDTEMAGDWIQGGNRLPTTLARKMN